MEDCCKDKININWVKKLPSELCSNSIYFVKSGTNIKMYVTNYQGVASQIGEMVDSTVTITSPDESILVNAINGQTFELSLSTGLKSLIESALQSGGNISELVNDAEYITLADIPTTIIPDHNELDGLQGGGNGDYYHLTEDEYNSVITPLELTTTGTSGASTLSAGNLNIPRYDTYADGKVAQSITDGVTDSAPSQNQVFDALALKANLNGGNTFTGTQLMPIVGVNTTTPLSGVPFNVGNPTSINAQILPIVAIQSMGNNIQGVTMENTSTGTNAEMRFVAKANDPSYLFFTQPSSNNVATTFFGAPKNTGSFIMNTQNGTGGLIRNLYIGTLSSGSLHLGTTNQIGMSMDNARNVSFVNPVTIPNGTTSSHAVNLSQLNLKANDADVVKLTGDQAVAGIKTFSSSPIVPTATTTGQAVPFEQLEASSQFVSLTEGLNTGYATKYRKDNPDKYGNIGANAVDLSYNSGLSTDTGALGNTSFAVGLGVKASGTSSVALNSGSSASGLDSFASNRSTSASGQRSVAMVLSSQANASYSVAIGKEVISNVQSCAVFGSDNDPISATVQNGNTGTLPIFIIGNGVDTSNRSNAFVVLKNGLATLPSITNALINAEPTGKAVVTKEYALSTYGATITIISDTTVALNIVNQSAYYGLTGTATMASLPPITGNIGKKFIIANKSASIQNLYSNDSVSNDIWVSGTATNTTPIAVGQVLEVFCDGLNWVVTSNNLQNGTTISNASTLNINPIEQNSYFTFNGTTSTWTLGTLASTSNKFISIINMGSGDITLNTNAGGNDIWDGGSNVNTMIISTGTSVRLYNNSLKYIIL